MKRAWYLQRLLLFALALGFLLSAVLAGFSAWRSTHRAIENTAKRAIFNIERLIDKTSVDLQKLDGLVGAACDEATVAKLKDAVYASTSQIRELGLIENNQLYCTNFGPTKIDLSSVSDSLKPGTYISAGPNVVIPNNNSLFVYTSRLAGRTLDAVVNPQIIADYERAFVFSAKAHLTMIYTGPTGVPLQLGQLPKTELLYELGQPEVSGDNHLQAAYISTRFPLLAQVNVESGVFWTEYWPSLLHLLSLLLPFFIVTAFVLDRVLAKGILNRARYKQALRRNQFKVFYQPIVSSQTRRMLGVEALLRWEHPKQGLMRASQFSELFNDTQMEEPIARFVMDTVINDFEAMPTIADHLWCSVNIAPVLLEQPKFVAYLMECSKKMAKQRLRIEITERTPVSPAAEVAIRELRGHGIRVGLDDFGTGYSNINQLQTLAYDFIKLDGLLIRGIQFADGVSPVLDSVIDLAAKLNTEIIAEGVEGTIQAQALAARNVRYMQGYLFSQARPHKEIVALVSQELAFELTRVPVT